MPARNHTMANRNDKNPGNVPGPFYVDTTCIDCDLCRETAPSTFRRDDQKKSPGHRPGLQVSSVRTNGSAYWYWMTNLPATVLTLMIDAAPLTRKKREPVPIGTVIVLAAASTTALASAA
jgi:hypothetical protein